MNGNDAGFFMQREVGAGIVPVDTMLVPAVPASFLLAPWTGAPGPRMRHKNARTRQPAPTAAAVTTRRASAMPLMFYT